MQRALSIAEIRQLICIEATDHTLVQLAQCCKSFHEPAIRVLWNTIPNLSVLVQCFPQDAWTKVHSDIGDSIKVVRPLAPEDWTAFLKYSNLVRQLGISTFATHSRPLAVRTSKLEQRVLLELSAYRPVFVLFPNLTTFDWAGLHFPEEDLPLVLGFLNPDVSRVHIRISPDYGQGTLRTSLALVANRYTSLKEFQLTQRPPQFRDSLQVMSSILPLLENFTMLEVFLCFYIPLTGAVLGALGNLQNLTLLAVRLPETMSQSPIDLRADHFPNLLRLVIGSRLRDYIEFGSRVSLSRVKAARIVFTDVPSENDLPRVITAICKQFSPSELVKLIVSTEETPFRRRLLAQAGIIRLQHLQPLFEFRKRAFFEYSMASRYALDAAAYLALAKGWPLIKTLTLGLGPNCVHITTPKMRDALVPFAIHCPKLTCLGVRFDATGSDLLESSDIAHALPPGKPRASLVAELNCFDSPIFGTAHVAAFLASIFPKLKEVRWKNVPVGAIPAGFGGLWKEVQEYLPLFATVREDGRLEGRLEGAEIAAI